MEYKWHLLDDIKPSLAISMFTLRHNIFAVERQLSSHGVDDLDKTCHHLCVTDENEIIGCLRLHQTVDAYNTEVFNIERFCVNRSYRRQNIGKKMIGMAIIKGMSAGLEASIELITPIFAEDYYRSLGFEPMGNAFTEDDVLQIAMKLSQPKIMDDSMERDKTFNWRPI